MPGFPLLDPPHHLVERIIAKVFFPVISIWQIFQVNPSSNFLLRQTCHKMHDIVQSSPNISARVRGYYLVDFCNSKFELCRPAYSRFGVYEDMYIDVDGCYGVRVDTLSFPDECDGAIFKPIYEILKKYRITCNKMELTNTFSTKQSEILIKMLKPDKVHLSEESEPFTLLDAVLNFNTVVSRFQ